MDTILVISPVSDDKIQEHINDSSIWKDAYHESEITDEIYHKHKEWYGYSIKFDGLKPIQCTKKEVYVRIR